MAFKDKKVFGWGIIGTGRIAKTFAECLHMVSEGKLVAVGSRSLSKSQEFCKNYGGTAFGSYQEMINSPDVDIVYVATPHHVHEDNVIMAAKAKKAILCEKPFSINEEQTRCMIKEARENNVFLMEGLWSRFFPAWQFAKTLIDSGELGKIEAIHSTTCWGRNDLPENHRLLDPNLAGGALMDAGIYSLAAVDYIMGESRIENITSTMHMGSTGVDNSTTALLLHPKPFSELMQDA